METLNLIRELAPATVIAALATLPWIAAALMYALNAASAPELDDKWNARAAAALRWAGALVEPARGPDYGVLQFSARRAARGHSAATVRGGEFYPHAA